MISSPQTFFFLGRNLAAIPCFRDTFMYSIGSGCAVGIVYNLATSKAPWKLAFGTYAAVTFLYWYAGLDVPYSKLDSFLFINVAVLRHCRFSFYRC